MSWLARVSLSTGWLPTVPKLDFVTDNSSAPGSLAAAGAAITPVSSRTATPPRSARMISPLAQLNRAGRGNAHMLRCQGPQVVMPAPQGSPWLTVAQEAAVVGACLDDHPLRPHGDRGLGVRRKRHVAPVATLEVDAPE